MDKQRIRWSERGKSDRGLMQMDIRSRFSPLVWNGDRVIWSPPQLSGHDGFHFHRICGKNIMVNLSSPHWSENFHNVRIPAPEPPNHSFTGDVWSTHGPTQTPMSHVREEVILRRFRPADLSVHPEPLQESLQYPENQGFSSSSHKFRGHRVAGSGIRRILWAISGD